MIDKPLDCFGAPLTSLVGKHDFRHSTTNTSAQAPKLDVSWLDNAMKAMKNLPPAEEIVHHAKVGLTLWESLKSGVSVTSKEGVGSLFGFPLYVDESLSPGECQLRNKDGKVLSTLRHKP